MATKWKWFNDRIGFVALTHDTHNWIEDEAICEYVNAMEQRIESLELVMIEVNAFVQDATRIEALMKALGYEEEDEMQRWRFKQDDDGHWFVIPADDTELFTEMLYDESDEYHTAFIRRFGAMMVGGHPSLITFTDPLVDRNG